MSSTFSSDVQVLGRDSSSACDALEPPLAQAAKELFRDLDPSTLYRLTATLTDDGRSVSVNTVVVNAFAPSPEPAPPATDAELRRQQNALAAEVDEPQQVAAERASLADSHLEEQEAATLDEPDESDELDDPPTAA